MNILITGGGGFIGSNLAMYFQKKFPGYKVVVFDAFNNGAKMQNGNYQYLGNYNNLINFKGKIICGDLTCEKELDLLFKYKFDIIFHLAAVSDTRVVDQQLVFKTNINTFYKIIELSQAMNAKLVYASSAAVYGNAKNKIQIVGNESPNNPYAFSKYAMDKITLSILDEISTSKIIGLRYFNVYGEKEIYKGATSSTILQFALNIMKNSSPILFENSCEIFRDFVYIEDVIQATINAGFSNENGIFNVGSGIARSFQDVSDIIQKYLKTSMRCTYIKNPFEEGYQYFTQADISNTIAKLDYKPEYTLELGILDYLKKIKI